MENSIFEILNSNKSFQGNINPRNFLSHIKESFNINLLIAGTKIFLPEFVVRHNLLFIEQMYDEKSYQNLLDNSWGPQKILNELELWELLLNDSKGDLYDDDLFHFIGKRIYWIWKEEINSILPNHDLIVEWFRSEETYYGPKVYVYQETPFEDDFSLTESQTNYGIDRLLHQLREEWEMESMTFWNYFDYEGDYERLSMLAELLYPTMVIKNGTVYIGYLTETGEVGVPDQEAMENNGRIKMTLQLSRILPVNEINPGYLKYIREAIARTWRYMCKIELPDRSTRVETEGKEKTEYSISLSVLD